MSTMPSAMLLPLESPTLYASRNGPTHEAQTPEQIAARNMVAHFKPEFFHRIHYSKDELFFSMEYYFQDSGTFEKIDAIDSSTAAIPPSYPIYAVVGYRVAQPETIGR